MYQIAVCDDEETDRQSIAAMAEKIMAEEGMACEITQYAGGTELLDAVKAGVQFHLFLLDVMMENLDGMSLAAALRTLGDDPAVIFISVNRDMALRGYEVAAVRYLSKPLERERLREALLFCAEKFYEKKEILLPTGQGWRSVPYSRIVCGEAMARVTRLVLSTGTEEVALKFSELAARLPERQFVLCHRSYFVNLNHVSYLRNRELELSNSMVLPVSKYRLEELQKKMVDYFSGR